MAKNYREILTTILTEELKTWQVDDIDIFYKQVTLFNQAYLRIPAVRRTAYNSVWRH